MRARLHAILEGRDPVWGRSVAFLLNGLILASAVSVALETMPELAGWIPAFVLFERIVVVVFAVEYGLRLWSSPSPRRYAFSLGGLIDLLAFLPSLLLWGYDWRAIRVLRLIRLVRLFKLLRFSTALDRLIAALREIRDELVIFSMMALFVLYLAAVGIYHFEHEAQPETFGTVPESMWWAVVSLTTVGYGDAYPITAGGRIFTALVLFVGLGVVAVPTGLIATALSAQRNAERRDEADGADRSGSDD